MGSGGAVGRIGGDRRASAGPTTGDAPQRPEPLDSSSLSALRGEGRLTDTRQPHLGLTLLDEVARDLSSNASVTPHI